MIGLTQISPKTIDISLNEIQTTLKRALRGMYFSWGEANEIANSLKKLIAYDPKSISLILKHFLELKKKQASFCANNYTNINTSIKKIQPFTTKQPVSPLAAGIFLNDFYYKFLEKKPVYFKQVSYPLLTLPWIQSVALRLKKQLLVSWEGAKIVLTPSSIIYLAKKKIRINKTNKIVCSLYNNNCEKEKTLCFSYSNVKITLKMWTELDFLASSILVLDNQKSRQDAGAIQSDSE